MYKPIPGQQSDSGDQREAGLASHELTDQAQSGQQFPGRISSGGKVWITLD